MSSLFIACSQEALDYARAMQEELDDCCECTIWTQGAITPSSYPLEGLLRTLNNYDFAAFLFVRDDAAEMRGERVSIVRDNVVLELGLFVARLGRERCFLIVPRDRKDLRIPTDLVGIEALLFDAMRSDGNLRAALGPATNRIRGVIRDLGPAGNVSTRASARSSPRKRSSTKGRKEIESRLGSLVLSTKLQSIVFVDIDRFSAINRWYGPEICDQALETVERLLRETFGEHHVIRLGGDQFVTICEGLGTARAKQLADEVVAKVHNYQWYVLAPGLYITVCAGVAEHKRGKSVQEWLIKAIHGCMNAKRAGGNVAHKGPLSIAKELDQDFEKFLS